LLLLLLAAEKQQITLLATLLSQSQLRNQQSTAGLAITTQSSPTLVQRGRAHCTLTQAAWLEQLLAVFPLLSSREQKRESQPAFHP